jgi:hypothetical protein
LIWSGRRFGTHYDRRPWTLLAELVDELEVELVRMGGFFIADGVHRQAPLAR